MIKNAKKYYILFIIKIRTAKIYESNQINIKLHTAFFFSYKIIYYAICALFDQ